MRFMVVVASCLAACNSTHPSPTLEEDRIGLGHIGVVETVSRRETCPGGWRVDVGKYSTAFHCRSDRDDILINTYSWGWVESIVILGKDERDATRQFDQIAPLFPPEVVFLLRPTIHHPPGSGPGAYIRPGLSCAAGPISGAPTDPYLVQWIEMDARTDPWWFEASNP